MSAYPWLWKDALNEIDRLRSENERWSKVIHSGQVFSSATICTPAERQLVTDALEWVKGGWELMLDYDWVNTRRLAQQAADVLAERGQ